MAIQLKSVYEACHPSDGNRYLAETFWPEGIAAYDLHPYTWLKELAPSYELGIKAEMERWDYDTFRKEYRLELERAADRKLIEKILREAEEGTVTLLCDTHRKYEPIGPEDTIVWDLRAFIEAMRGPEPGRNELPSRQRLLSRPCSPEPGRDQLAEGAPEASAA